MKKTLIALAAVAATTTAMADVTIYGRLDVGMNNTKVTVAPVGADTLWIKNNNAVSEDGLSTGLLGFKGTEDLGGGMSANFVHEMDLDMDVGALGVAAGRNSTVGLKGGFGELRLGRSYTPLFSTIGMSDVFGTTGAGTVNTLGMAATAVRASNAIFYTTPAMGGFTASVMVQNNNAQTSLSVGNAGKSSANGFSLNYASGPLAVAFANGTEKGSSVDRVAGIFADVFNAANAAAAAAATANTKYTGNALSATYDLGVAKAYFGYVSTKDDNDTTVANGEIKMKETNVGVAVPMGSLTLMGGVGRNKASVTGEAGSATGTDVVLGATYALSKRTTTYIKTGTYGKYKNETGSVKTTRTSVGLRHTF